MDPDAGSNEVNATSSERESNSTSSSPTSPASSFSSSREPVSTTSGVSETLEPDPSELVYGDSLIMNGDFASGEEFWTFERVSGAGFVPEFDAETLCVSGRGGVEVLVGWPANPSDSLDLPPGRYRFAFRVRGKGVHLSAKVGHAYEPYETLFEADWTGEEVGWHDVVHEFEFAGDDAAGLAFTIQLAPNGNTMCFDEVTLRRAVVNDENSF